MKPFRKKLRAGIILVVLLFVAGVIPAFAADFIMKGKNKERQHFIPASDVDFPYTKRNNAIVSGDDLKATHSSPRVQDDILYAISSNTGRVVAWDLITNKVKWVSGFLNLTFKEHPGSLTIVGDKLVIPAGEQVWILDKATGKKLAYFDTAEGNGMDRFATDGLAWNADVYVGSDNGNLYGFDLEKEKRFLMYDAGGRVSGSPVVLRRGAEVDRVAIGVNAPTGGKLLILSTYSRSIVSVHTTTGGLAATGLSPDGNYLYSVDKYGNYYKYDALQDEFVVTDNGLNAAFEPSDRWQMFFTPALNVKTGKMYVATNRYNTNEARVYEMNPNTGSIKLVYYRSGVRIAGSPVAVEGGYVLFTLDNGEIRGIDTNKTYDKGDDSSNPFNWYHAPTDPASVNKPMYKMKDSESYSEITLGSGHKKIMLVNGEGGIYQFEPWKANIQAIDIRTKDTAGKEDATFKLGEKFKIEGDFENNGVRGAANVKHGFYLDGKEAAAVYKSYDADDTNTVSYTMSLTGKANKGQHKLYVFGDSDDKIEESDEKDNKTAIATITLLGNPPVAKFTATTPVKANVPIELDNQTTEPDGDTVSYIWSYQKVGATAWTEFSRDEAPASLTLPKGSYTFKLVASDEDGSSQYTQAVQVVNSPPAAGFKVDKPEYYVGDPIIVTSTASDPDGDPLTYDYQVTCTRDNFTSTTANFTFKTKTPGTCKIVQKVTDPEGASSTAQLEVPVYDLMIQGHVEHTADWKKKHDAFNHLPNQFYSGEQFVLKADVSPAPIDWVQVSFLGRLITGKVHAETVPLKYVTVELYDSIYENPVFADMATRLANGPVSFFFKVHYSNGTEVTDTVQVDIIGSLYDSLRLHQSY